MKKVLSFLFSALFVTVSCSILDIPVEDLSKEIDSLKESVSSIESSKKSVDIILEQLKADNASNAESIATLTDMSNKLDGLISALKDFAKNDLLTMNEADARYATIEKLNEAQQQINSLKSAIIDDLPSTVEDIIKSVLGTTSSTLDGQISSLDSRVKALEDRIQSIKLIPSHSDGIIRTDDNYAVSIKYIITPENAVDSLGSDNFKLLVATVATKSASYAEVNVTASIDGTEGTVTLKADLSECISNLEENRSIMVSAKVSYEKSELITDFTLVQAPAHRSVQLWENGPRWASENIGARKSWNTGYYFSWGNTTGYTYRDSSWVVAPEYDDAGSVLDGGFSRANYAGTDGGKLNSGKWGSDAASLNKYDAARASWGEEWRTPSLADINALINNTDKAFTENYQGSGVAGWVFTGKDEYSGNSIFFPMTGRSDTKPAGVGTEAYYWTNESVSDDKAYTLFLIDYSAQNINERYAGCNVRPVKD